MKLGVSKLQVLPSPLPLTVQMSQLSVVRWEAAAGAGLAH